MCYVNWILSVLLSPDQTHMRMMYTILRLPVSPTLPDRCTAIASMPKGLILLALQWEM